MAGNGKYNWVTIIGFHIRSRSTGQYKNLIQLKYNKILLNLMLFNSNSFIWIVDSSIILITFTYKIWTILFVKFFTYYILTHLKLCCAYKCKPNSTNRRVVSLTKSARVSCPAFYETCHVSIARADPLGISKPTLLIYISFIEFARRTKVEVSTSWASTLRTVQRSKVFINKRVTRKLSPKFRVFSIAFKKFKNHF